MPTLTKTNPAKTEQFEKLVRQELAQASQRIRLNDVLVGGLALGITLLAYAVGMMILDQWLVFPAWVRLLGLGGLIAVVGLVAYRFLWRPFRLAINPQYAARQVEETLPDAKNAIVNYVDLQDENLPATVKAGVAAEAALGIQEADLKKATESSYLLTLGLILGALGVVLASLMLIYKPNPFFSLLNRAFNPIYAGRIASKTELTLVEPASGDVTITNGDPLPINVFVSGSIPSVDSPNRLRVQVRATPEATEIDEFPLEQTGGSREWGIRLPSSVIQTGLWYCVAGNDARTAWHQVTVRSRPIVRGFEATYTYPPYTRLKDETDRDPRLIAYRGTQVTLQVKANRELRRGWLQLDGKPDTLPAEILRDSPDTMRFRLTLMESGSYRIGFTSVEDEASEPTVPYSIKVLIDQPPTITIDRPSEETVGVPMNGSLELDTQFSDDFGLGNITLKLRLPTGGEESVPLQARKHRNQNPLPRGEDGSAPRSYTLKETLKISEIRLADGRPIQLGEGQLIEYWYEASDNCTVPKPNVGKSAYKRIKLGKALVSADDLARQNKMEQQRRTQEKDHQAKQDQQLKEAKRPAEQLRPEPKNKEVDPEQPEQKQPGDPGEQGQPGQKEKGQKGGEKEGNPKQAGQPQPGENPKEQPKTKGQQLKPDGPGGETTQPPMPMPKTSTPPEQPGSEKTSPSETPKGKPEGEPMKQPDAKTPEKTEGKEPGKAGQPGEKGGETAPMPKAGTPEQRQKDEKIDQQANQLKEKLEKQERDQFGQARPEGGERTPEDAPMPKPDPKNNTGTTEPKTPKEGGNTPPKADKGESRGQPKPQPAGQQPQEKPDPAQSKPMPDEGQNPEQQPSQGKPENGPGSAGTPKEKSELSRNIEKPPKGELSRETNTQGDQKIEPPDQDVERLIRQGDDLNSQDQQKRENAEKEFDKQVGQEKREDLQRKLQSKDQKEREQAKKDIDELAKKKKKPDPPKSKNADGSPDQKQPNQEPSTGGKSGQKESAEQLQKQAQDLNSSDPNKRQDAEKKFDEKLGQKGREQLQQDMKQSQNGTPEEKQAAQERIKSAMDQAAKAEPKKDGTPQGDNTPKGEKEKGSGSGTEKKPTAEEMKKLAEKAEDLASNDPAKREKAEKEFDQMIGEQNRQKLQQDMKDLNSSDQKRKEDAQRRLENQAQEALKKEADKAGEKKPSAEEIKDLADKAKDLNNPDPKKQEAARKALDEKLGQQNREKLERDLKDLNSKDPKEKKAAEDRVKQAADEMAKAAKEKPPTKEDLEKFAKEAEKLASQDAKEREQAEKKFDKELGEDQRKQLQQDLQDMKSGDAKKQQEAMKRLQNAMKDVPPGEFQKKMQQGGRGRTDQEGKPIEDDPKNRLKTAELQLRTLKEAQKNEAALKELGYTPEEYERFLKAYEERVQRMRQEMAEEAKNPDQAPKGPTTLKVGEGSGGKKRETRSDGTADVSSGGAGTAPPGYSEAQKRFAEEAAKLRKNQEKK